MDAQDVLSGNQFPSEVEREHRGFGVWGDLLGRGRRGVEHHRRGDVLRRDLVTIQVGDEPVLDQQRELERLQLGGICDLEWQADVDALIDAADRAADVTAFSEVALVAEPESDPGLRRVPGAVVEGRLAPRLADVRCRHEPGRRSGRREVGLIGDLSAADRRAIREPEELARERRRELAHRRRSVAGDQAKVLAVAAERKVAVEFAARQRAVLSRREHDEQASRWQVDLRELPARRVGRVVSQKIPAERNHRRAAVAQLDPVGGIAIFIRKTVGPGRGKFADHQAGPGIAVGKAQRWREVSNKANRGSKQPHRPHGVRKEAHGSGIVRDLPRRYKAICRLFWGTPRSGADDDR